MSIVGDTTAPPTGDAGETPHAMSAMLSATLGVSITPLLTCDTGTSKNASGLDVSLSSTTSEQSAPSIEQPSRLMTMPRELRDMVYEELGGHNIDLGNPLILAPIIPEPRYGDHGQRTYTHAWTSVGPLFPLLTVSKQLSAEYADFILQSSVLVITDRDDLPECLKTRPEVQFALNHISHVYLHIINSVYGGLRDAEKRACAWVRHLQSLAPLINIRVLVEIRCMPDKELYYPEDLRAAIHAARNNGIKFKEPKGMLLQELGSQKGVSGIEVMCSSNRLFHWTEDDDENPMLYGTWTERQGWKSGKEGCLK